MRWVTIGVVLTCALGCRRLNADHCANLHGDETCRERDASLPWCNGCAAEHDGCVSDPVEDPACGMRPAVDMGSGGPSSSTMPPPAQSEAGSDGATSSDPITATAGSSDASTGQGSSESSGSTSAECGDGVAEDPEVCDGDDLSGVTCENLGLGGGTLVCASDCASFETGGCDEVAVCGDGVAQGNETCDGDDLRDATCLGLPEFADGDLACDGACELDASACEPCRSTGQTCGSDDACCSESCGALNLCA
jgi:hypothetical protein